jgi:hypothetical protein
VLLFNNKTQGLPYHTFVLAIALLCENRFPGAAIASGDIGPEDSEEARRLLERTLGESFDLPLVVQRTRLEQRLSSHYSGRRLRAAVQDLGRFETNGMIRDLLAIIDNRESQKVRSDFERLVVCTNVKSLHPTTQELLGSCVNAVMQHITQLEWPRHPRFRHLNTHEACLTCIAARGITLTERAWTELGTLPLRLLQLVTLMSISRASESYGTHFTLAVLENQTIRSYLVEQLAEKGHALQG